MGKCSLKITKLDMDGRTWNLGTDNAKPIFHFVAECSKNGAQITATRLLVHGKEVLLWDSGKQSYENNNYIVYDGPMLCEKMRYEVTLILWDESDVESEPCYLWFETGFLGTAWEANWIEPQQEDAIEEKELSFMEMIIPNPEFWGGEARLQECKELRRNISIEKEVLSARIYATAHGIYQLYIDGEKISERRFAPENSAYQDILYYQTYDVTEYLKKGTHSIGAILADGWWIGRLGMAGDSCNYGKRLGFLMQMEIVYADGTKEIICSDETFEASSTYICYSDLYIGEKQDSRRVERDWTPCKVIDCAKENLLAQPLDGVCVTDVLEATRIFYTPKEELVIDFGQVIAGVIRITLEGEADAEVVFEHAEVLDREGNYINNILGRNKDQKDILVCKGGVETFEPQFTYHGFRYVRVTGIAKEQIKNVQALVMGSPIVQTGKFHCNDERINQLQHNIMWSTKANMFSVPTDCPQREKLGWTGDIQVYTKTGCFNYNLKNFLETWLANVRVEQNEDGEIPVVIPNPRFQEKTQRIMSNGSNSSAVWGDACVLVPWYLYECYGDKRVLEDNFSMMEKWMRYIKTNCELKPEGYSRFTKAQKARNPYLWTKQYHFGDWLIPSLRALPDGVQRGTMETAAVVGSAYYAVTISYFIKVLQALGREEECKAYKELLTKVKDAVREEFVSEDGTVNDSSLQGLYVIILKAGIVEGELREKVAARLVQLIEENGNCLDTGFASVSYLLDVLTENGYRDVAYRLLFQTQAPSWLYMVKNGATTIWENWLAIMEDGTPTESSYNHYAFGCVGEWIYRNIGGIINEDAGYRSIRLAPDMECGLTESECALETPYGEVSLHWKREGHEVKLTGAIPVGVDAILEICGEEYTLTSGAFERCVQVV